MTFRPPGNVLVLPLASPLLPAILILLIHSSKKSFYLLLCLIVAPQLISDLKQTALKLLSLLVDCLLIGCPLQTEGGLIL